MSKRLEGKVAFVTGGGSGIGAATAERFAQEGAIVVICGRRKEPLDAVVAKIKAAGGKAEAVVADVGQEAQIVGALEQAARNHGGLDILVNNAMGGSIVNLSSICGTLGTPYMSGYSAAKAAVINFSRAAAAEGAPAGVRVNVVIPAVVETPATAGMLADDASRKTTEKLNPMGRVGQSHELANAILFLASDEASYVTGAALPVDGGRSAVLVTAL